MARGIAANEPVVSQAQTRAFDEGADRIGLGKSRASKERGVWVLDRATGRLVRPWEATELDETRPAKHAPISVDRHYEGVRSPIDGTVFQSRRQHKQYMKDRGLTTADDFNAKGGYWDKAALKRAQGLSTTEHKRDRRDRIGKRLYEVEKLPQKAYDQQVQAADRKRRERGTAVPTE